MRAAVLQQFGEPLVIEDRPIPEPDPGQITVQMQASRACATPTSTRPTATGR